MLSLLQRNTTETYPAKEGFYENIPFRVNSWITEENTETQISFMTTDAEICNGVTEKRVILQQNDNGWLVKTQENGCESILLNTADQIENAETERKRALWHVKKYIEGVSFTSKQRYTDVYTIMNSEPESLFSVDPYFHAPSEQQETPFIEYLDN